MVVVVCDPALEMIACQVVINHDGWIVAEDLEKKKGENQVGMRVWVLVVIGSNTNCFLIGGGWSNMKCEGIRQKSRGMQWRGGTQQYQPRGRERAWHLIA
jgi:hypothetical protein